MLVAQAGSLATSNECASRGGGLAASPSQQQGTSDEPPGASRWLPGLSEGLAPASERSVAVTLTSGPRLGCFGHEMYVFFQRSNQCLRN